MQAITYSILFIFLLSSHVKSQDFQTSKISNNKDFSYNIIIPVTVGIIGLSLITDESTNSFFSSYQNRYIDSASGISDLAGDKYIMFPASLVCYATGRYIINNKKLQNTSWLAIQSFIATAITTEAIKQVAGRARPYTDKGHHYFRPFPINNDHYKSFPSGHAATAFAIITPFAEEYSRWLYILPTATTIGRAYQNKHWASDVATGAGIGLFSGLLFTHHPNISLIPNGIAINF